MNYTAIILVLGVITAAFYLSRTRDITSILIVAIQTISVGLTLMVDQTIGYYVFGATILLAILYPYIGKGSQEETKWMWLFLLPILITFVFGTLNLPGYGVLRLLMLLPLGIFIYALINISKFRKEMGFMILFAAYAIIKVISLLLPAS